MQSRHFRNDALMSHEMVLLEGSWIDGRPAVNRLCNSWSLIMLTGRLFLVTHLTRWARTSGLVWTRCEYLTSCLPLHAKNAKMELLHVGGCWPAIAALIASSPKQQRAWYLRLA